MVRRSDSVLLFPVLAALALFYPLATRRSSLGLLPNLSSAETGRPAVKEAGRVPQEWDRGRLALKRFFGQYRWQRQDQKLNDARDRATVHFLIVTVPDPIDSGLPHVFDRYMASLQAAAQTVPYFLSDFELPWQDCLHKKTEKGGKEEATGEVSNQKDEDEKAQEQSCRERRFAKEPGFLLMSKPTSNDQIDILLVYLVGETPTSGVQKRALRSALREIARYCHWWKEGEDPLRFPDGAWPGSPACKAPGEINILGPSYSGAAQSLDVVLSSWIEAITPQKPNVKIVSGSATAIDVENNFRNTKLHLPDTFTFSSMELPDSVSILKFFEYLRGVQPCGAHVKIALMVEGGTVYGKAAGENEASSRGAAENGRCDVLIEQTKIPYPCIYRSCVPFRKS